MTEPLRDRDKFFGCIYAQKSEIPLSVSIIAKTCSFTAKICSQRTCLSPASNISVYVRCDEETLYFDSADRMEPSILIAEPVFCFRHRPLSSKATRATLSRSISLPVGEEDVLCLLLSGS